jgi:hypothetical protein
MHVGYREKNKNVFNAKHATAQSVNLFLQLVRFRFRFARPERQWFSVTKKTQIVISDGPFQISMENL